MAPRTKPKSAVQLSMPLFPTLQPVPERRAKCPRGHVLTQYEYCKNKFVPVRCYRCPREEPDRVLQPMMERGK